MCHQDDKLVGAARGEFSEVCALPVVSDDPMPTVVEWAEPGQSRGCVLLITDIYGLNPFYRALAARLADAGFTTALPDFLFHQQGKLPAAGREAALARSRKLDQRRALADVSAVGDWLKGSVGAARLGVLGFCLGGTFALDLAAERDDLAIVSYYGFPHGNSGERTVPAPLSIGEHMRGPILALWGEDDYMGMESVHALCNLVAEHNPEFAFHIYPGVGHGFLGQLGPGGQEAVDAWSRTTRFFVERLAVESTIG